VSGTKISAAADVGTPTGTDMVPLARAGSTTAYHATAAELQTFIRTGRTDGSAAPAGLIGEIKSTVITTPVTLTPSTTVNVGSLSLPAGDWTVYGEVWFSGPANNTLSLIAGITQTSATLPAAPASGTALQQISLTGGATDLAATVLPVGPCVINMAATTTVYLCAQANFPSGTPTVQGKLVARRSS
jgi:hypothetical protein